MKTLKKWPYWAKFATAGLILNILYFAFYAKYGVNTKEFGPIILGMPLIWSFFSGDLALPFLYPLFNLMRLSSCQDVLSLKCGLGFGILLNIIIIAIIGLIFDLIFKKRKAL